MSNQDHPVPTGQGKRWWKKLTPEERELHTDWRFAAGHRNKEVMDALGLSVGTIAGQKRRWSEKQARLKQETATTQSPSSLSGRPKMAASEATQCDYIDPDDELQCGFEWSIRVRGRKFCLVHKNCGQ